MAGYGPPTIDQMGTAHRPDALNPRATNYARQRLAGRGIRVPQGQDPAALWRAISASIFQGTPPLGQPNVNLSGDAYGNQNTYQGPGPAQTPPPYLGGAAPSPQPPPGIAQLLAHVIASQAVQRTPITGLLAAGGGALGHWPG